MHGAKWYSTRGKMIQWDFSHLRFKYSRRSTEITINTIKQFIMLYIVTEIWLNMNIFLNFWAFVTINVSCFATGQNDTVDHIFLTFWKMKWYLTDIAVSFNFLVTGKDSFNKNILKMLHNRVKLDHFGLYHFAPTTLYHFAPVTLVYCSRNNSKIRHPTIVLIVWRHNSIYIVQFPRYN